MSDINVHFEPFLVTELTDNDIVEFTDITDASLEKCYNLIKSLSLKYYKLADDVYNSSEDPFCLDKHRLGWIPDDLLSVLPKAYTVQPFKFNIKYNEVTDSAGVVRKYMKSYSVIKQHRKMFPGQVYANMYGALQKVIQDKEKLEETITQQQAQLDALLAWAKTQGYSA
jgi:hypothetical protein